MDNLTLGVHGKSETSVSKKRKILSFLIFGSLTVRVVFVEEELFVNIGHTYLNVVGQCIKWSFTGL